MKVVGLSAVGLLILSGIAAAGTALAGNDAEPRRVQSRLSDFKVVSTPKAVPAGRVTFVARNVGKIEHELVVVRTARDASKLGRGDGTAIERGEVAEVEDIAPGQTRRLTVTLKRGHYALVCNIGKHYGAGMYTNFIVR